MLQASSIISFSLVIGIVAVLTIGLGICDYLSLRTYKTHAKFNHKAKSKAQEPDSETKNWDIPIPPTAKELAEAKSKITKIQRSPEDTLNKYFKCWITLDRISLSYLCTEGYFARAPFNDRVRPIYHKVLQKKNLSETHRAILIERNVTHGKIRYVLELKCEEGKWTVYPVSKDPNIYKPFGLDRSVILIEEKKND